MKRILLLLIMIFLLTGCRDSVEEKYIDSLDIKKDSKYLYSLTYDDYNTSYNEASKYFIENNGYLSNYMLSCISNNGLVGNTYDYYNGLGMTFIVKTNANDKRYSSIGVVYTKELNIKKIKDKDNHNLYAYLPYLVTSGINEHGLVVVASRLPVSDGGYTTGTNLNSNININGLMLVRYLLDNAKNIDEVIDIVKNKINYYSSDLELSTKEYHFMINDGNKTIVIEFIDNKVYILENENIMTNYYLGKDEYTKYAHGIERYDILKNNYDSSNDILEMVDTLKKVDYKKAYDLNTNPFWYSEYADDYMEDGNLTYKNIGEKNLNGNTKNLGEYEKIVNDMINNKAHSSILLETKYINVYDTSNKKLNIMLNNKKIEYGFVEK